MRDLVACLSKMQGKQLSSRGIVLHYQYQGRLFFHPWEIKADRLSLFGKCRFYRRCHRYSKSKSASLSEIAFDRDIPAMQLNELFAQGKPEAGSAPFP
jgi:hypothetical protein